MALDDIARWPVTTGNSLLTRASVTTSNNVNLYRAIGYASGNFGKNLLWSALELTLLFYLTDVLGIDPAVAGWSIFFSLCVSIVFDPIMGNLADRLRTPLGRSAPLILIGSPICGIAFALLFALPELGYRSVTVATFILVIFRFGFALMDAPHNSLLATLTLDSSRRGLLSAARFTFSSIATVCVVVLMPSLRRAPHAGATKMLTIVAAVGAMLSITTMLVAALSNFRADNPSKSWHIERRTVTKNAQAKFSRKVIIVLLIALILNTGVPMFSKMILYHANYIAMDPQRANIIFVAMVIGQLLGMLLWTPSLVRHPPVRLIEYACRGIILSVSLTYAIGGRGRFVDAIIAMFFGVNAGGLYMLIWLLVAECVDNNASHHRVSAPSFIFSLAIVMIKAGQAICAALSGQFLSAVGFKSSNTANVNVVEMITGLQVGGPILACVIVIALISTNPRLLGTSGAS